MNYPRTGSRYISEDVFEEVPALLRKIRETLPTPFNRHSVDSDKVTDHHAIIPTGETPSGLSADETTIHQMVVRRFIEAFSPDSEEERMQVELSDGTNTFIWKACRSISLGWKAVQQGTGTNDEKGKEDEEQTLSVLPNLTENEVLPLLSSEITEHKTKPKPLYTEATLLSAMENAGKEVSDAESKRAMAECGIGTPATRANIIETLILRDYIRREKKTVVPTEKGLAVYEIVKDKRIANAEMTGSWELTLAAIEAGQMPPRSSRKASTPTWRRFARNSLPLLHRCRSPIPPTAVPNAATKAWASMPRLPNAGTRAATSTSSVKSAARSFPKTISVI